MSIIINNPGNLHASTLTVGGITNGGAVTGTLSPTGSVTIPVTGAGLAASSSWVNSSLTAASVNIHQDGIDLKDSADIKIGDQSLKEFMQSVSDRLSILVPDPAKLEKYAALKQAYDHYKLLEKLCMEDN